MTSDKTKNKVVKVKMRYSRVLGYPLALGALALYFTQPSSDKSTKESFEERYSSTKGQTDHEFQKQNKLNQLLFKRELEKPKPRAKRKVKKNEESSTKESSKSA